MPSAIGLLALLALQVSDIEVSPDEKTIAVASVDDYISPRSKGRIRLIDLETSKEKLLIPFDGLTQYARAFVSWSPDGKRIASVAFGNQLDAVECKIWTAATGKAELTLKCKPVNATLVTGAVAFSPDGKTIALVARDVSFRTVDSKSGKEVRLFKGHGKTVTCLAWSADGKRILSGSDDKTVRLWEASTGKEIKSFSGPTKSINSAAVSPDGKTIAACGFEKPIRIWDVASGKETAQLAGHDSQFPLQPSASTVVFTPDGKRLISAGISDGTIRVWTLETGAEERAMKQDAGGIGTMCLLKDGTRLLSGDGGLTGDGYGRVRVWNIDTGECLKTMTGK